MDGGDRYSPSRQLLPSPPKYVPTFLSYPHAGQSQRGASGVPTTRKRDVRFIRNGSRSHSLQNMRACAVSNADRKLPPLRACTASAPGVYDSDGGAVGGSQRRDGEREVRESRNGREYRPAHSPTARVALDDAEPTAVAVEGVAFVSVAHRKRTDDAEPRHARKDFGSVECGSQPLLHSGIGRRSAARRSIHSGAAAVLAPARLGAMAVDPEEVASDQRSRQRGTGDQSPPYR